MRTASPRSQIRVNLAARVRHGLAHGLLRARLHHLGQRFRLEEMLGFYRETYGLEDCGHVLVALSYFDGADRERMPTMLERWGWPSVKSAIRGWVRSAAHG